MGAGVTYAYLDCITRILGCIQIKQKKIWRIKEPLLTGWIASSYSQAHISYQHVRMCGCPAQWWSYYHSQAVGQSAGRPFERHDGKFICQSGGAMRWAVTSAHACVTRIRSKVSKRSEISQEGRWGGYCKAGQFKALGHPKADKKIWHYGLGEASLEWSWQGGK